MRFISASVFFAVLTLLFHTTAALPAESPLPQKPELGVVKTMLTKCKTMPTKYKAWYHGSFKTEIKARQITFNYLSANKHAKKQKGRKPVDWHELAAKIRLDNMELRQREFAHEQALGNWYRGKLGKPPKYGVPEVVDESWRWIAVIILISRYIIQPVYGFLHLISGVHNVAERHLGVCIASASLINFMSKPLGLPCLVRSIFFGQVQRLNSFTISRELWISQRKVWAAWMSIRNSS